MNSFETTCKYCSCVFSNKIGSLDYYHVCDDCRNIQDITDFVSNYDRCHKDKVWNNKVHEKNMILDNIDYGNGVKSYTLAKHKTSYRVEKRTHRVQMIIDKISKTRFYLYTKLERIFETLDSIYIKHDIFWGETGNLLSVVHDCCMQEAVLKLRELLIDGDCKYSIIRISNSLKAESKYVFKEQQIYEKIVFLESKDEMEEIYEPFDIEHFLDLIAKALQDYSSVLRAIKDYRDNQIAHISELKNKESPLFLTYVNLKRIYSLSKAVYDGLLFVVAPDKYSHLVIDSNIFFGHLNEMTRVYKKYLQDEKKRLNELIKNAGYKENNKE